MDFDSAFAVLINPQHEGSVLSTDRTDPGNWTGGKVSVGQLKGSKYGISAARYPNEDIANLTVERSKQLYRRDFWDEAGCPSVPDAVRFDLFDMAVNSGPVQAIKTLQTAVGSFADGALGPKTLLALSTLSSDRLIARYNAQRLLFMTDLKNWADAGKGWARRIANNILSA